jgi:hypothetical protein
VIKEGQEGVTTWYFMVYLRILSSLQMKGEWIVMMLDEEEMLMRERMSNK